MALQANANMPPSLWYFVRVDRTKKGTNHLVSSINKFQEKKVLKWNLSQRLKRYCLMITVGISLYPASNKLTK